MKAQINALPFVLILIVLVIGLVSFFVYLKTSGVNASVSSMEHKNFIKNVEKKVNDYAFTKKRGSSEKVFLRVPNDVKTVCFVDRKKDIMLSSPVLDMQINADSSSSIFFDPSEFHSAGLSNFTLKKNPLCINAEGGAVSLKFESRGDSAFISAGDEKSEKTDECTALVYSGDENKISIVFLGFNYENSAELGSAAGVYISQVFEKISPFAENIKKFNFYQSNLFVTGCSFSDRIKCSDFELKRSASRCPHDYIVLLAKRSRALDALSPVRSSATSEGTMKINTGDAYVVVMAHEFGHAFGNLADEYVDATTSSSNFNINDMPNCDSVGCRKWAGVEGASCFKKCTTDSFYRPTENSIMNLYYQNNGDKFGPVNEKELSSRLGVYE
jgi:hypothetical protein